MGISVTLPKGKKQATFFEKIENDTYVSFIEQ